MIKTATQPLTEDKGEFTVAFWDTAWEQHPGQQPPFAIIVRKDRTSLRPHAPFRVRLSSHSFSHDSAEESATYVAVLNEALQHMRLLQLTM